MHMCICIAHKMVLYFISVHLFLKPFSCIGNLRAMLTFGLVSSKVCITYSRCYCNKLWRSSKYLNI